MKTEVIISIIAVVVVLAVLAYVVHNKDTFTPTNTYMTPLQIATQKGYSQIVTFLKEQANTNVAPSIQTAQETVYLINYATSEIEALNIIKTMYWPRVGASANTSVLVQNYHPFGGLPTPGIKTVDVPREPDYDFLRPMVPEFVYNTNSNFNNSSYAEYLESQRLRMQMLERQRLRMQMLERQRLL